MGVCLWNILLSFFLAESGSGPGAGTLPTSIAANGRQDAHCAHFVRPDRFHLHQPHFLRGLLEGRHVEIQSRRMFSLFLSLLLSQSKPVGSMREGEAGCVKDSS